ncbi:hypothetical protein RZS08_62885, partial [Arthrospira platensis SPKY1]|nr:hypothetical protein [Arthrospira platensis SPKY1]
DARHAGHVVVGQHQVETIGVGTHRIDRLLLVAHAGDPIPAPFQQTTHQKHQGVVVVEVENVAGFGAGGLGHGHTFRGRYIGVGVGHCDGFAFVRVRNPER